MRALERHLPALLGGVLLAAGLALSAATLTDAPALFGDEAWYASTAWSAASGHGLEPSIASGSGVYDAVPDYWASRLGSLPHVLAEEAFPTSVELHRGLVFATALLALAVFGVAMHRLFGIGIALLCCAALVATFGFYSASHWIRWDSWALVFTSVIMLLLVSGPPRPLAAAAAGGLIGLAPDFALGVAGIFPGVLVLCAWERELRLQRVGALLGGVAVGGLVFGLLHFTGGWSDARTQYDVVYEPIYGEIPVFEALGDLSLNPLLAEADRYARMTYEPFVGNFAVLAIGALAMVVTLARALGAGIRPLAALSVAGVAVIAYGLLQGDQPYDVVRYLIGLMIVAGFAAMLALGWRAIAGRRDYPTTAVPAVLLASMLVGYGLLLGYKGGTYVVFCFPLVIGSVASALRLLSPPRLQSLVPTAGLVAFTLLAGAFLIEQIEATDHDPALDPGIAERARQITPEDETVMGEWVYWWLYEDERFRFNSSIWLQRWLHPSEPFAASFHRVCPDDVLLDDLWLDRYRQIALGRQFASQAPTRYAERAELLELLRREYRAVAHERAQGRKLVFWERKERGCG